MGDFIKELYEDVVIEVVNITRATMKEALDFKTILSNEIDNGCIKMIVDLSSCAYMDSTFLGTIVVALKKMRTVNGKLVLISPKTFAYDMLHVTGTLKLFDVFESMENALKFFDELNSVPQVKLKKRDEVLKQEQEKIIHKESVRTSRSTF